MTIRSLNGLSGNTNNVYVNTNLSATLPLEENQSSFNNPITISLKGLNGLGTAGQVIRMNSGATALEYGDDEGSNWTVNGSNIYPTGIAQVIVNTTSNTNNRNLLINGTGDIVGNLYFGNNNDIYIKAQGQNMRNYAGYDSGTGASHLFLIKQSNGVATEVGSIKTGSITNIGNANISSGNSKLLLLTGGEQTVEIINNNGGGVGGSPYLSFECQNDNSGQGTSDYYIKWVLEGNEKMRLTTSGLSNVSWLGNTIIELYGGTGNSTYSTGDILYSSASNTLSKLSIGNIDQVLTVKAGIPSWEDTATPDLTTATNFGTAVQTGTIKMGNSSGNSYTANIELYVSSKLSIFNTSNVEVAKFEPASNTCDLSLFGGVLSNATIGANTQYLGTAITYNYGGTGLSSLTANKILQVNSTANGYNLIDLPTATTQHWSETNSVLSPLIGTNSVRAQALLVGSSTNYTALDYNTGTNEFVLFNNQKNEDFFEYNGTNGYINWGPTVGARMNFRDYVLHGDDNVYPQGVGIPFGTIRSAYFQLLNAKSIITDRVTLHVLNASPSSVSSSILLNSAGEIYFSNNKLKVDTITGNSLITFNTQIKHGTTTFQTAGNHTITLPSNTGVMALVSQIPTIPTQYWSKSSGVLFPSTSTDAIRSSASLGLRVGSSSNYTGLDYNQSSNVFSLYNTASNINFFEYSPNSALATFFTQIKVPSIKTSGNNTITLPTTSGTMALIQSFTVLGDIISGPNTYGILYDPQYTKSLGNAYLKYHTNGTDLRLNCRSTGTTAIHMDHGNSNTFSFTNSGELKAKNSGQAQYTHKFQNVSGQISSTDNSTGFSIQGNDSYITKVYTKGFVFAGSTTTTLWNSTSIRLYWDGSTTQPRFDIKSTAWWDIAIDHIQGTSGSTNPLRTTSTNDTASSGSGLFFSSSTTQNSAFNITSYGTFVRGALVREGLSTTSPAIFFEYCSGNTGAIYLTLRVLGFNLTN